MCHYLHILVSSAEFCRWQVTQLCLPGTIFVFLQCLHMRSPLVENSIPPLKMTLPSPRLFQLSVVQWRPIFLSGRAANPSLVWQLEIWLTYHLFVQERTRAQASYWICFGWRWHWPETQREVELEKSRTEVRGISVNLIPQCLDVFKIYWTTIQGTQSGLHVVFWRPQIVLTSLYPMATHHSRVI